MENMLRNCSDSDGSATNRTDTEEIGQNRSTVPEDSRHDSVGTVKWDESENREDRPDNGLSSIGGRDPDSSRPVAADWVSKRRPIVDRDEGYLREIASRDRRLADLERTCKSAVRERELAMLLSGRPLVPGAAAQLIKLWREEFDVYEENGTYKVTSREGQSVEQVVNEWLASSEYSHFCLPASRGGTGARDASKPGRLVASENSPRNLGEVIVMKWREESAAQPDALLKPIGLRRHR
jgi:hypothetical protein